MPSREPLAESAAWCAAHVTGDDLGQTCLFRAFGQPDCLDLGGTAGFRGQSAAEISRAGRRNG